MDSGAQRVVARIGGDVEAENRRLLARIHELEAALEAAQASVETRERSIDAFKQAAAARAAQEEAVWKWTRTPLEETGKRLWRALCTLADAHGVSTLDLALADLGPMIGKSERAGRRAYDGEKHSPHTGLKASGLVRERDRFNGRIKIELLDPLDVRRARLALSSLGQHEQTSFLREDDVSAGAQPEFGSADCLEAGGEPAGDGRSAASPLQATAKPPAAATSWPPDAAGMAPYPPAKPPSPPIHSLRTSAAQIHHHPHRSAHDGHGARAPDGGRGATPAGGAAAEAISQVAERALGRLVEESQARASSLAAEIVAAVNDPNFCGLEEFAADLATAVEVDGDFRRETLHVLLRCVGRRRDGQQPIANPGGWFRASVRRRAGQIIRSTLDRRGNVGGAIQALLGSEKPHRQK